MVSEEFEALSDRFLDQDYAQVGMPRFKPCALPRVSRRVDEWAVSMGGLIVLEPYSHDTPQGVCRLYDCR